MVSSAAQCSNCGETIQRRWFPFCSRCRLLVIDSAELDLSPDAELDKLYRDDDNDEPRN